ERGPRVDPLATHVWLHDLVAHELHDRLERVHKTGWHSAAASQIPLDRPRHHDEHDCGDEPEHEDVLRDREIDPQHRREWKERVCQIVRDMLDNRLAGIELLGRLAGVFLNLLLKGKQHGASISRGARSATEGAETQTRTHSAPDPPARCWRTPGCLNSNVQVCPPPANNRRSQT